ncbi:MAG: aminotransferase class V-fold PLP-dependent enzyme [Nitrospirae bacterium]|nr:aminotransferase class V-fold PLP-dependent enzyme [Nitrospirota bacterium]
MKEESQNYFDKEFNLREGLIYLNHAAVSPWPVRTAKAVQSFAEENMVQGSLNYLKWIEVDNGLRSQAQELLNARTKDSMALVKNTSEALSFVAYGLDWKESDNIVSTNQEFPSNRIVWESLRQKGVEFREADISTSSSPEDAIFSLTDNRTRLITISSVQFPTGLRMELARIGEFCKSKGILFCVDAIQSLGALRFDVESIGADFVMADGHKWMLGPEGLGIFYCRPEAMERLNLTQYGWHMVEAVGDFDRRDWSIAKTARRFECGSSNTLGIYALSASLSLLLETGKEQVERDVLKRSEYLFEKIKSNPELELITSTASGRYSGIVTFRRRNVDPAALYRHLSQHNVVCALRGGGIRLSPHFYTPYDHLDRAIDLAEGYIP